MDCAGELQDSTDWLDTPLQDFATLENALHCEICKEFYDTPMITSCCHTFCSKCIRTSLSADGRCPACRTSDQASKLRNNYALQEIVRTFRGARPQALKLAKQEQLAQETRPTRATKRKRAAEDCDDEVAEEQQDSRTTRRKSRRIAASQTSDPEVVEVQDSDGDGDYNSHKEHDDGLVHCLFGCGKRIKPEHMDAHLDRCEDERKAEEQARKRQSAGNNTRSGRSGGDETAPPRERLAELNYSMMKDSALAKKLRDLGIPTTGNKQLMIKRHTEWVNIWNANCDSNNPRSKADLKRDLEVWERTQGARATTSAFSNSFNRKDFDTDEYATKNKAEFSRLIADARRKKANPATEPTATPKEEPHKEEATPEAPPKALSGGVEQSKTPPVSPQTPNRVEQHKTTSVTPNSDRPCSAQSYANNPEAIASVRQKVEAANAGREIEPVMNAGFRALQPQTTRIPSILSERSNSMSLSCSPVRSSQNHNLFDSYKSGSHSRSLSMDERKPGSQDSHSAEKIPMFAVPEKPVKGTDVGEQTAH